MRVIVQEEALRKTEGKWVHHIIHELPTIDAEPVRHGRWIDGRPYTNSRWKVCSVCYISAPYPEGGTNYCPACGAKMDAKDINAPTKPEAHRPEDCVNYATRTNDGRAVCLGTRELDTCDGAGCKRWKGKVKDE